MDMREHTLPSWLSKEKGSIYFLGIGGSGMYGVARLAHAMGFHVSGADARQNENTATLKSIGIPLYGEEEDLPKGTALVVYSLAVPPSHPRRKEAEQREIPCLDRAAFFGILMRAFPKRAAVAGSHGKSSTTAMCAEILEEAGFSPTVVSGASLRRGEDSFREGRGELLLFEACEYKDAFLSFCPTHALVLDVSWEHTDYFADYEATLRSFRTFLRGESVKVSIAPDGLLPADMTFGEGGEYTAEERRETREGSLFTLCRSKKPLGRVALSALGSYQIENALGAAALCSSLGVPDAAIVKGLSSYSGIPRRMEKRGYLRGAPLYLDFAHHPKELFCALRTASHFGRPLAVVFEPHTYSRTKTFFEEYASVLRLPLFSGVLPVYAAREASDPTVSSSLLAARAGITFLPDYACAARFLTQAAGKGCTLLLIGAGGVEEVLSYLTLTVPEGLDPLYGV